MSAEARLRAKADATKQSTFGPGAAARWIASRSLSSGGASRDPVARNDVDGPIRMPRPPRLDGPAICRFSSGLPFAGLIFYGAGECTGGGLDNPLISRAWRDA
jgi:hypothetical protein